MKVLDYNGLISLTDIIKENFIFRDTKENVKKAIDEGKIPENAVVIITDDIASNGQECNFTPADIGLDKVGNYKAVSTEASQELTEEEKLNARNNIGAGTSSFSGSYNDLSNKPPIPTKTSELTNDSHFLSDDGAANSIKADALVGNSVIFREAAKASEKLVKFSSDGRSISDTSIGNSKCPVYFDNGVPVAGSYTLADACAKGVATAVANGNTNLVTSGAVYTALQNAGGASVESGTWTPKLVLSGGHLLTSEAHYWKIGKMVIISTSFFDSSSGAAGSGNITKIQQLPFKTWYCGNTTPVPSAAGHIIVLQTRNQTIMGNNVGVISVKQNITEIDMTKESMKFGVANQVYKLFGVYLTD